MRIKDYAKCRPVMDAALEELTELQFEEFIYDLWRHSRELLRLLFNQHGWGEGAHYYEEWRKSGAIMRRTREILLRNRCSTMSERHIMQIQSWKEDLHQLEKQNNELNKFYGDYKLGINADG